MTRFAIQNADGTFAIDRIDGIRCLARDNSRREQQRGFCSRMAVENQVAARHSYLAGGRPPIGGALRLINLSGGVER